MKLSKFFYNESKWCQGEIARKKDGTPIRNLNIVHRDGFEHDPSREAESFSLHGAVQFLYPGESQGEILFKLSEAVRKYTGQKLYTAQFNDLASTTFEDIKSVLEISGL